MGENHLREERAAGVAAAAAVLDGAGEEEAEGRIFAAGSWREDWEEAAGRPFRSEEAAELRG